MSNLKPTQKVPKEWSSLQYVHLDQISDIIIFDIQVLMYKMLIVEFDGSIEIIKENTFIDS